MRNVSTFVIVGVLVVVVALALIIRAQRPQEADTTEGMRGPQGRLSSKEAAPAGARGEADEQTAEASRRARVQERLERLRSDAEQRKLDSAAMEKRDLPILPTPRGEAGQKKEEEEEPDPEDEALKQTILNDPDPEERASAVFMLSGAEDQDTMRVLMKALEDPDAEVRLAVVEALGDYTDEISPDVLTPALNDSDPEVRFEAIGVLGDMDTPEALEKVRQAFNNDPEEDNRELAAGILDMADEGPAKPAAQGQPAAKQQTKQ